MPHTIRLLGPSQKAYAHKLIDDAPPGYVMKLAKETRTDRQNAKLWPVLRDIRNQVEGLDRYSLTDTKYRFMNLLGVEMRFLPELETEGFFPVGMSSSILTVDQFGGLLNLAEEYGARHGVRWSREDG